MCSSETKPHPTRPILIFVIADASGSPRVKAPFIANRAPAQRPQKRVCDEAPRWLLVAHNGGYGDRPPCCWEMPHGKDRAKTACRITAGGLVWASLSRGLWVHVYGLAPAGHLVH